MSFLPAGIDPDSNEREPPPSPLWNMPRSPCLPRRDLGARTKPAHAADARRTPPRVRRALATGLCVCATLLAFTCSVPAFRGRVEAEAAAEAVFRERRAPPSRNATVLVIRHGEEHTDDVTRVHLTELGLRRARWLPTLFETRFPRPLRVFARKPEPSERCVETVQPTAESLGLTVDARYGNASMGDLVEDVTTSALAGDGPTLVCWHHAQIPALVAAFGWRIPDALVPWPKSDYDTLVEITLSRGDGEEARVTGSTTPERFPG